MPLGSVVLPPLGDSAAGVGLRLVMPLGPPCWGLQNPTEIERGRREGSLLVVESDDRMDDIVKPERPSSTSLLGSSDKRSSWLKSLVVGVNGSGADGERWC